MKFQGNVFFPSLVGNAHDDAVERKEGEEEDGGGVSLSTLKSSPPLANALKGTSDAHKKPPPPPPPCNVSRHFTSCDQIGNGARGRRRRRRTAAEGKIVEIRRWLRG